MLGVKFLAVLIFSGYCCINCYQMKASEAANGTSPMTSSNKTESFSGNTSSSSDSMNQCNQTFRIQMEYLQELNDTGSFPDESEKTPMCFIKCILENAGVVSGENKVNKEIAVSFYQLDNEEIADDCITEMTSTAVKGTCETSYFFVRCLMSRMLLQRLGEDNDNVN